MQEAGAQADPDGSRAPGRRGRRRRRLPRPSTASCCRQADAAGDPALAGRRCSTRRWPATGARPTSTRPPRRSLELIARARRPRSTASRCRCWTRTARSRLRRRLPAGVRLYTGDDFNYPALIAGDERGYSDALLGIFAAIAPPAAAALRGPGRRATPPAYDAILDPTVPLARHLFERADLLLQDRHRVPGLARRPPGPLHDGRRAADRPLAARTWPSCSGWPTRPGCCPTPTWPRPARGLLTTAGVAPMKRFSLNQATAKQLAAARAGRAAASTPASPASACGATRSQEYGVRRGRRSWSRRRADRHRPVPGRLLHHRRRLARRQPRAPSTRPPALGTRVLVLVFGGLAAGQPRTSHAARAARRRRARRAGAVRRASAGVRLAIEPLHPMFCADRCVVSTLGQALDLAEPLPAATRSAWSSTPTTSGGTPQLFAQIARAGAAGSPAFQVCDWVMPLPAGRAARPRHARRRLHRLAPHHRGRATRPATPARSRSRSSTRPSGTPTPPRPSAPWSTATSPTSAPSEKEKEGHLHHAYAW